MSTIVLNINASSSIITNNPSKTCYYWRNSYVKFKGVILKKNTFKPDKIPTTMIGSTRVPWDPPF